LTIDFSSCTTATGTLSSTDGSDSVTYDNLVILAGVLGAPGC
jgi:hypothetical protein